MEFWFVRHGESAHNAAGLYAGREDSPLTARGLDQARAAADLLALLDVSWVVSSPLGRARATADFVAAGLGLPVFLDDRLVEHGKGSLEGKLYQPLSALQWASVPGAEPMGELYDRVRSCLVDLSRRDGVGVVVAHAGVARAVDAVRFGLDQATFYDQPRCANADPYLVRLPSSTFTSLQRV
jgi:probable phosphoglycerate mutase